MTRAGFAHVIQTAYWALEQGFVWARMQAKTHPAGTKSLALHALLLLLIVTGLPSFLKQELPAVHVVTVEMLPVKDTANVKPKKIKPTPRPSPVKSVPVKPRAPKPKKITAPKPRTVTKPTPKALPKEEFASVLKSVETLKKEEPAPPPQAAFDPSLPLSITDIQAIISQISRCWVVPAGAQNAQDMAVSLRISLARDGAVQQVSIVDQWRYKNGDAFFRAAADSAVRAVRACSPLKNLPLKKYHQWKELELRFDPRELLY